MPQPPWATTRHGLPSARGTGWRTARRLAWPALIFGMIVFGAQAGLQSASGQNPETKSSKKKSPLIAKHFDKWLSTEKVPTVRELSARFIAASGVAAKDYDAVLDGLAQKLREGDAPKTPRARAERLRATIFVDAKFQSSTDLSNLENLLPQRIVARKTGYCIGLTLILLDLCERVGWEATAISAPRHTFLRLVGDEPVNVETTLAGELHDDDWYRLRFSIGDRPATLRPLSIRELGGHLLNNVAYVLLEAGAARQARAMIERSLKLDPRGVEAITNLGVCQAREGEFEKALIAFGRTLEHWPDDPVTRLNRVNALLPLGRQAEAVRELTSLLESHPGLSELTARALEIRDQFEIHHNWVERQRLSMALIEQEVAQRGALPGLSGVYHKGIRLSDPKLRRIDRTLEFQWGRGGAGRGIPSDRFSARWTGWIEIPIEDEYTFLVSCSDGVRIWIDGRPVIDAWRVAGDNFPKGSIPLLSGKHEIRVEYFESVGTAGLLVMLVSEKESDRYELAPMLFHPGPPPPDPREKPKE